MEKIEMTCRCGASISIEMQIATYAAKDWQENHKDCKYLEQQPTTATPTPTANMMAELLDVEERIRHSTQPSSQSDQADTENGPAEPNSECAHEEGFRIDTQGSMTIAAGPRFHAQCWSCRAWTWFAVTPVPAAAPTSLTSVKQASKESVDPLAKVSAESPSNELSDMCRVQVLQDSHCILPVGHNGPHKDSNGQLLHQFDTVSGLTPGGFCRA